MGSEDTAGNITDKKIGLGSPSLMFSRPPPTGQRKGAMRSHITDHLPSEVCPSQGRGEVEEMELARRQLLCWSPL